MAQELKQVDVEEGIRLVTGIVHELKLRSRVVGARLPGQFRRFRSFPRPDTLLMAKQLLGDLATKPDAETVVVGHSDQFGSAAENNRIAKSRAEATVALLTGDLEFFKGQFRTGGESAWGSMEVDDMLEAIDAAEGFQATGNLLLAFKAKNGLGSNPSLDSATISRLCEKYLALLGPRQTKSSRFRAIGAGGAQPMLGIAGGKAGSDDMASPDFRDRRRVEVFVFDNLIVPSAASFKEGSAELEPTYQVWCDTCERAFTVDPLPLTIRLRDSNGEPLAGRQLELLSVDDATDQVSILATQTTDSTGVARFAGRQGAFFVRLVGDNQDETAVTVTPDRINRFLMVTMDQGSLG